MLTGIPPKSPSAKKTHETQLDLARRCVYFRSVTLLVVCSFGVLCLLLVAFVMCLFSVMFLYQASHPRLMVCAQRLRVGASRPSGETCSFCVFLFSLYLLKSRFRRSPRFYRGLRRTKVLVLIAKHTKSRLSSICCFGDGLRSCVAMSSQNKIATQICSTVVELATCATYMHKYIYIYIYTCA